METFYSIQKCYYDNEILIQSDVLTPVLLGQHSLTQEQLSLLDIPCHISLGKKCNDFIFYEGIPHVFFSQRMVDVFAEFVDVSKYFYPIKIKGVVNAQYYIDICWPKVQYLKQSDAFQNFTTPDCTTGEPPVSWWAQQLGHDYGRTARFANRVCQPNIYNTYH